MYKLNAVTSSVDLSEIRRLITLMLLTICTYLLYITPAFAAAIPIPDFIGAALPTGKMAQVICSIYGLIAFDIGRALATLAIAALGVGAMLGRVTWGQVATVAVGIGVTMGAITIAFALLPVAWGTAVSLGSCGVQAGVAHATSAASAI